MPKLLIAFSLLCFSTIGHSQTVTEQANTTATSTLVQAKPEDVGMSSEKLALIRPKLAEFVEANEVPHAIVCVARKGKIVLLDSVGWSDIDTKKKIENHSILRFYSMTKAITSVAVMMLVEEGKVDLDEPVSKYIPEFAALKIYVSDEESAVAKRAMTTRDLLRHTSGLTYGFFGNTLVDQQYRKNRVLSKNDTLKDLVRKLSKLPLLYSPGEKFNYSVSTDVLGHLVEQISNEPLDEFFADRIFEPLGMRDTAFQVVPSKVERFVNNYGPNDDGLRVIDDADNSAYLEKPNHFSGGGGLTSTAPDYIRFCQMLLNKGELDGNRLLETKTIEEMTRNQLPKQAYPITLGGTRDGVGFGLGFSIVVEKTEYTKSSHVGEFGWGGAASTHFWISPKDELAVVLLTQHMPFTFKLEDAIKPLVYDSIAE